MLHTLRGTISNITPLTLDKTLSLEGASADAKAVGDAIQGAEKRVADALNTHKEDQANPHKVTAEQVGLGKVDNTSDMEKPVSTAQAQAINEAKTAAGDAKTSAETAEKNAKQFAQDAANTAENNAKTHATDAANTAEKNAKDYADSLRKPFTVALLASGWSETAPYTQTVEVEGILGTDTPHWGVVYSKEEDTPTEQAEGEETETETETETILEKNIAEKEAFALVDDLDTVDGSVTFTCFEDKPEVDLTIQMEVNR